MGQSQNIVFLRERLKGFPCLTIPKVYRNLTAGQARETIAVIETAEHSSAQGRSLPLPAEVYEG